MSAKDILKIKDKEIEYVDLRFTDPRGKLQRNTRSNYVDEDMSIMEFFDGSSIAGWKALMSLI